MSHKQKHSQPLKMDKIEINEKELQKFKEFVDFQRGFLNGIKRMLTMLSEQRFGVIPKKIVKRIKNADDFETLENWGIALLSAQTLDDVFKTTH